MSLKTVLMHICLAICTFAMHAEPYKVRVPLGESDEGATAYLVNQDSGENIDSVRVADKTALFSGDIDESIPATVMVNGRSLGLIILEGGSIALNPTSGEAFGSMLNDQLRSFSAEVRTLNTSFRSSVDDGARHAIYSRFEALSDSVLAANPDNALGYLIFLPKTEHMDLEQLRSALDRYPYFKEFKSIQRIVKRAEATDATQPGKKFVDFEVSYNGKTSRLSDYVGRGHYTLVDFWASWCVPCIRQTAVIKKLYAEYGDKGLEVLGVAVWDKPEDTIAAISRHQLQWECLIGADENIAELYGITGIPCIILFAPDGTIISRGKQGDELVEDVRKAMDGR